MTGPRGYLQAEVVVLYMAIILQQNSFTESFSNNLNSKHEIKETASFVRLQMVDLDLAAYFGV